MTTSVIAVWQAVCVVLCLASYITASDIVFTSSPSTIRQLVTEDLTMRCSLKDNPASVVIGKRHVLSDVTSDTAPSDVSFLQSIIISKAGVDVASVAVGLAAKVFDNSTGVLVTGQVPGAGDEMGYLQVGWKYPDSGKTGSFMCVISGIDQNGHVQTFTKTLDVGESEALLSDVVGYIQQLKLTNQLQTATINDLNSNMTGLNSNIAGLNSIIAGLNASNNDMKVEMNHLKTSNTDLTVANAGLKMEVNNLKTSYDDLKVQFSDLKTSDADLQTKLDTHVMFTATLTSPTTVLGQHVVVFDQLKTSIGGGYNPHTGVFTSQVAGYYMFDLHVQSQAGKNAKVCLAHNNNRCVTSAVAEDGIDYQSGSTSAVLELQMGDIVKVISRNDLTSYVEGNSYGDTSFSGLLVSVA